MEHAIQIFRYNEQEIEFDLSKDKVMVNATEMAKIFGKRVNVFMKADHVNGFINTLERTPYGVHSDPLSKDEIYKNRGQSGLWMHRLLALKFAAWLDPKFEVWVYYTIEQVLFGAFRRMEEDLRDSAQRRKEIRQLKEELCQDDRYQQLERLELEERHAVARRRKFNQNQLELFMGDGGNKK